MLDELLITLASCLCSQIEESDGPGVCFCGVVPGEAVIFDYAGDCTDTTCGMAWARLITVYPATGVGLPNVLPGNCNGTLGVDIELGIVRCASIGDDRGNPPSPSELTEQTLQQVADAILLFRAVQCCEMVNPKDAVVSAYTPVGPDGGMVGGAITVMTLV